MSNQEPDLSQFSVGLTGWNHLTQVLGVWIPARLKNTRRARLAIRRLRTHR